MLKIIFKDVENWLFNLYDCVWHKLLWQIWYWGFEGSVQWGLPGTSSLQWVGVKGTQVDYYDSYCCMHALMNQKHFIAKSIELRMILMPRRDYLHSLRRVKAAISVHSFGNVLIYPWGYKVNILSHKIYKIYTYDRCSIGNEERNWFQGSNQGNI